MKPAPSLFSHGLPLLLAAWLLPMVPTVNAEPSTTPVTTATPAAQDSKPASVAPGKREKPPLPGGPLLARMGDYASWQIKYTYAADAIPPKQPAADAQTGQASPEAPEPLATYAIPTRSPRLVVVKRTKPYWCAITTDIKGQTFKHWSDGTDDFLEAPATIPPLMPSSEERLALPNFARTDFPGLEWISPGTYAGVETVGDVPCLVFTKDDATAWVRLDNRMPLKYTKDSEIRAYSTLPKPSAQLVFPEAIERVSAAIKKDRKYATQPVPRGG